MSNPNRRGVGLSAFSRNAITSSQYASHGATLRTTQSESLRTQLSVFQSLLHQFNLTHSKEIRSNPQFRAEFARMCQALGVDPLGTAQRGGAGSSAWAQMLGGSVNDFYYELAVRVVEVCRDTRAENGGMIGVGEVQRRVRKGRGVGGGMEVSEGDVLRAVEALKPLGGAFSVMRLGGKQMIRSVPKELNTDQSTVLEAVQVLGYVTDLMTDSLLWVDLQAEETEYWSPTFGQGDGAQ